jgi:hypothetical protein
MWERGSMQKGNCRGYRVDFIGRGGRGGLEGATAGVMAINGHGGPAASAGGGWQ